MDIDLSTGQVTFRVLYVGPEGATKFINVRGLHAGVRDDEKGSLTILYAGGDRIVSFLLTPRRQPQLPGLSVAYQIMTAPGRLQNRAVERLLVRASDAVVFLPERGQPAGRLTRRAFGEVAAEVARAGGDAGGNLAPILVQDYEDGDPRLSVSDLAGEAQGTAPVLVPVTGDTVESILKVFDAASREVIERCRSLAGRGGAEELREILAQRASKSLALPLSAAPAGEGVPAPDVQGDPRRTARRRLVALIGLGASLAFAAWRLTSAL